MFYIDSSSNDPCFNIATEEFLLRESKEEFFMLYIDRPSVIVGKHQNAIAEINYKYVKENNIPVIRRISGGGTVVHDSGNLNFCYIANSREGFQIDFKKYIQPIVDVLINKYGISAEIGAKNDIRVNGLKISGNAEHVFKNRVLHHGTLLVSSNLHDLAQALYIIPGKYIDKAVKSIRSEVTNLSEINTSIEINSLKSTIKSDLKSIYEFEDYTLSTQELAFINNKIVEKFNTWKWNFGYSPSYIFRSETVELLVENGIIVKAKIPASLPLEQIVIGKNHDYDVLKTITDKAWELF